MHTKTPISQADADASELLSVAEAAALLRVNPRTIRNRIRAGLLPARTLAGTRTVRVERRDVLAQWQPHSTQAGLAPHGKSSPLVDRLGTPEGRARALAALDALTEGDELEQRDTIALLARAEQNNPLALREAIPQDMDRLM